jgi:hypothetical protein
VKTALKTNATSVRLQERADVVARTVISQQGFYQSDQCSPNQRQLLETMVGAAIWYFPQSAESLWTGLISVGALTALAESDNPKTVKLTKDHHYPRKVAASELFALDWSEIGDPAAEVLRRYLHCYGRFNYVLPDENKRLVKYQKTHSFVSPEHSYALAGIELVRLSLPLLKEIQSGDSQLASMLLAGEID